MQGLRFSLADKISMTIIAVGVIGILLSYYICITHRQFSYQHHTRSIQQLAAVEIRDLIENLRADSIDLALSLENDSRFDKKLLLNVDGELDRQLNNQFYQYFVTAGIVKLLKLYIFDSRLSIKSISTEGIHLSPGNELICPQLKNSAMQVKGAENLIPRSDLCLYKDYPVYAAVVPIGGLKPDAYVQVVTDLAYSLRKIGQALGMPVELYSVNGKLIYQSADWQSRPDDNNYLTIEVPVTTDDKAIMNIVLKSDISMLNKQLSLQRNRLMSVVLITTALSVLFVLLILRRSAIQPLAKIHDVLEQIRLSSDSGNEGILFEHLLEQIIHLRRKNKSRFSVMILDLTHFKNINDEFGNTVGDLLLLEVEKRLHTILRDSDLISWIGTDTPGHKLLPADSKTQYRATIARLGGDEFGMVLPSAQSEEQASSVATRIVDALNQPFIIQDQTINIDCKIGISIYPVHGEDEKLLIRNADKAMYQARELGQKVYVFDSQ